MSSTGPYKMGTISRMTGYSPILLRAWERRYELLEPERGKGGHRLYTDDDLLVLQRVRELMETGRSIGEIAALGRTSLLDRSGEATFEETRPSDSGLKDDSLDRSREDLVRAAVNLDAEALNRYLDDAAATVSFETLIERVIEPAAREIGDLWAAGECSVASEHLATSIFAFRLRKVIESAETFADEGSAFVIGGCLPDEEHQLGLLILSYFLNRHRVRVLYLGASLPFEDLRHACRVARPHAVLLSVTRRSTFRKHRSGILELYRDVDHRTSFYLGGQGRPVKDAELEEAGLRLPPATWTVHEAARRIAADVSARKLSGRRG